jgi:hypothetical protein
VQLHLSHDQKNIRKLDMKKNIFIAIIAVIGSAMLFAVVALNKNTSITLGSDALLLKYSTDDLIKKAELIVIGEAVTTLPSRWNAPDGSDLKNASPEEVARAHGLFTDSLISINQILKGDIVKPVVRVRSFIGETEKVRWVNESEPSFVIRRTYLLFLAKDTGATARVDPGDYISLGAYQGVYEIVGGKAISADDEWVLEDLIAYIQSSLSQTP